MSGVPPELLAQLRPIHLPPPVAWWPPAPGWWVIAGLLIGGCGAVAWWWRVRRPGREQWLAASRELESIAGEYRLTRDERATRERLSAWWRRVAVWYYGRTVAGITGGEWLAFLDRVGNTTAFTHGVGRELLDAPYRPDGAAGCDQLLDLAGAWLEQLPASPTRANRTPPTTQGVTGALASMQPRSSG